jgi:hypothetical protein
MLTPVQNIDIIEVECELQVPDGLSKFETPAEALTPLPMVPSHKH